MQTNHTIKSIFESMDALMPSDLDREVLEMKVEINGEVIERNRYVHFEDGFIFFYEPFFEELPFEVCWDFYLAPTSGTNHKVFR